MGITHLQDISNMKGITPNGILTDIRTPRGNDTIMIEGYHLTLLTKHEIAISILQGETTIGAWSHTFNRESTTTIRA